MNTQSWFQKDNRSAPRSTPLSRPILAPEAPVDKQGFAARLRPAELIAMLTHHYARVRSRSLPRVTTTLQVATPNGKAAVTISFG
jgi:hypothetical protein